MTDTLSLILLLLGGLAASILASVTGFGGAVILLPITIAVFGVQDAIPILTIAQLIGNGSRVWLNRREVSLPVIKWFSLGSVPTCIIGGMLFAATPAPVLIRLLGILLIGMVVQRHIPRKQPWTMPLWGFAPLGAISGLLSAMLGSVGPLAAPFFLSYGLVKGCYIGTEALAAVVMHATKAATYMGMSVLAPSIVGVGLLLGPIMILGSLIGKSIVDRIPARIFVYLIEGTIAVAGIHFIFVGEQPTAKPLLPVSSYLEAPCSPFRVRFQPPEILQDLADSIQFGKQLDFKGYNETGPLIGASVHVDDIIVECGSCPIGKIA